MTSQPLGIRGISDYMRSVRSDLSGHASVGYVKSVNAPTVARAVSTTSFDTVTAQIGLNYILGPTLTGSILYTFSYQNNGALPFPIRTMVLRLLAVTPVMSQSINFSSC
jgi:hypothetical protein